MRSATKIDLQVVRAARAAGLRYVYEKDFLIRRRRAGSGFLFIDPGGGRVVCAETIARIRALAIPPAWTDVQICVHPRGHIQAIGRDARGRRQYRYHPTGASTETHSSSIG